MIYIKEKLKFTIRISGQISTLEIEHWINSCS